VPAEVLGRIIANWCISGPASNLRLLSVDIKLVVGVAAQSLAGICGRVM
jgi:hypothetical protein